MDLALDKWPKNQDVKAGIEVPWGLTQFLLSGASTDLQ